MGQDLSTDENVDSEEGSRLVRSFSRQSIKDLCGNQETRKETVVNLSILRHVTVKHSQIDRA